MRRIGVFSGAFDPVHKGHLRVIQHLLAEGLVDSLIIVPNGVAPYRALHADMTHLRAMVDLAIAGMERVRLVDQQLIRGCRDTVEVLQALRRQHPADSLTYIMGADKLAGMLHWSKAAQVFDQCDLLVFPRDGFMGQEMTLFAVTQGVRAQLLTVPHHGTSSSRVRALIGRYDDAADMIPREVSRYIALHGLYQRPFAQMIRPQLNQHRLQHTLGVRDLAVHLAFHHQLPMQKAAIAALLHDTAKGMKLSQLQAIVAQYHLAVGTNDLGSNALLHGPVGAVLAEVKYDVHDEEILGAIRYHTTGRGHMTGLELCVFVADAAEAGRSNYPGLAEIRALMWTDLRRAALVSMLGTAEHLKGTGIAYSDVSRQAIEELEMQLQQNKEGT